MKRMIAVMLTAVLTISMSCGAFTTAYADTNEGNFVEIELPENYYYAYSGGDTVYLNKS